MRRALFAIALVVGCRDDLADDASIVDAPRILAVVAEPPEAAPGGKVTLSALYTDGTTTHDAALSWVFCSERRALAETGPVAPSCLDGSAAIGILGGSSASAVVPRDACRTFGPDLPLAKPGTPAGRPSDPDPTGGYYQPGLVGGAGASAALFELRIRCALASVTQQVSLDFEQGYHTNTNPTIASVTRASGEPLVTARRGETVHLRVAWPPESAEAYVSYDPGSRALVPRREAMTVSWLVTRGRMTVARTGRDEADPATSTENAFTAPAEPGAATLFVVLRDARGGAAFRSTSVGIE